MRLDLSLLQRLLEATPDAVLIVDGRGTIEHANAAVQNVFGWAPPALVGQPVEVLVPPAERGRHAGHRARFDADGRSRKMGSGLVVRGQHADGRELQLDIQLAPLAHNGERMTVAVARNVGHILRLQDELAQYTARLEASLEQSERDRERLERLDAEKNQLLGITAHDLRNPLSALRVFTDLLEDGALGAIPVDYQPLVQRISRSVDYMSTLVDQILDWSAIEAGHLVLRPQPTDLVELVHAALEVERLAARAHDVVIEAALDPAVGTVTVDGPKLEQVVHNLVANGVRFSPPGQTLRVRLARVDDEIELSVADRGPGVPLEDRDRIFQPYARRGDERYKGFGLGLAIVARIVEGHGGRALITDTPGGGATFVVRLPTGGVAG